MGSASRLEPPSEGSDPHQLAELLCALSYGSGLAVAERMEHGTNTAFVGTKLGRALGFGPEDLEAVFYGVLIKDVGCGACSEVVAPFLTKDEPAPGIGLVLIDMHHPDSMGTWAAGQTSQQDPMLSSRLARLAALASRCSSVAHEAMTAHCEIATDFAATLGFGRNVQEAVHYQYERYDRRGPLADHHTDGIPRPAEVMHLALAVEIARSLFGADGAAAMVRQRTGSYFHPEVAEAYLDLAEGLWPPDFDPIPLAEVLNCDPGTSAEDLSGDRRSAVCEALGDFADLKSARRGRHSHEVAGLALEIAGRLGLPQSEQDRLYRAGLVHDLGKVAVPYRLLEQMGDDTSVPSDLAGEAGIAEPVRLHPYYSQRILARVRPLADLAAEVGAHHERIDGSGYPFGLGGEALPIGARVLGVADTSAERAGNDPRELSERGLDPECLAALGTGVSPASRFMHPSAGANPSALELTSRELEVLHRLAAGASNPDISNSLYISRRTVEHHVEHILRKLKVSSRTAAVAYALTHGLLD